MRGEENELATMLTECPATRNVPTYPAEAPYIPLDRLFISAGIICLDGGAYDSVLSVAASDHLPLWADLEIPEKA